MTLPEPGVRRGVTVVEQPGEPLAALMYHPSLRDEPELVAAVSAAAAISLRNGRLQAEQPAAPVYGAEIPCGPAPAG